ncbi:MAG: hypothetical protein PVJ38_03950 [Candidatus Bathyarchaeota archaeon]|jgi:hypothetical protein
METEGLRYPFSVVQYFIPEFVARLRGSREVTDKPSPRQSITMCELLLPAYLRKGHLTFGDLVEVAVSTSKIENQDLAERFTYEILLDVDRSEEDPVPEGDEGFLGLMSQKSDDLVSYLPTEDIDKGEPTAAHDSDVDIFKEFTGQPDIGVGPGEDELLKVAVRKYKGRRNEVSRMRLAEFLKVKLLKLGRELQHSMEAELKPMLRPFEYGDDPADIDEERSLENIFDQGKRMEEVAYQDFLIRKKNRRKKAVVFILDISNTMFYEMDGLTSIHFSVLCLVPLLWSLRKERHGVIFYESNSHVQEGLHEERDIDEIIDNLLLMVTASTGDVEKNLMGSRGSRVWGGTVPTRSLRWAMDELESSSGRVDRICFYFSDFVLQDPSDEPQLENYSLIERMVGQGIRVVACVSPLARSRIFSPYTEETLERVRRAGAEIIETEKPSDFLGAVQELLDSR